MRAKELMLNDLVLFDNRVCKIVATNAYRDCVELIDISDKDEVIGKYAKHISPIPLTAEILKKNGFILKGKTYIEQADVFFKKGIEFYMEIMFIKNNKACVSINSKNYIYNIEYVHELQHVLRLCGLTKLAANLKVK